MASKLLQGVGIFAVIALIGAAFGALAVVKGRIHVTVAEEEAAARRAPDPIALLAADVGAVREELSALGEGVGSQMQALHDALEGSAGRRQTELATEVAELRRELVALQARLDKEHAELADSWTQVHVALAQLEPKAAEAAASSTTVAASEPAPIEVAPELPAVAEAPPEVIAESAPTQGFLSFKLPAQGFAFDRRQRFAILPSLSRVGFDAKSTLHDFSGVTTAIEGEITADLARPGEGCSGTIRAQSGSLDTGLADRDEAMSALLEPAEFPEITFEWSTFEATRIDAAAQTVAGVASGKLTIHGTARELTMPVSVAVDASKRLAIDGEAKIKLSEFGLEPPSKLGLISVEDEVTVWIALRARTLGPAASDPR